MSLESKVVIRLIAETEMEKIKPFTRAFKDAINVTKRFEKAQVNLIKAFKKHRKATQTAVRLKKEMVNITNKEVKTNKAFLRALRQLEKATKRYNAANKKQIKTNKELKMSVKALARETAIYLSKQAGSKGIMLFYKGLGMAITAVKYLSAAIVGATAIGIYSFANVADEIAKISLVMDDAFDSTSAFMNALISMSEKSTFSARELGEAMFEMGAMMGDISSDELRGLTDISQQLAIAAGFDDVTRAGELMIGTYRMFGGEFDNVTAAARIQSAILMNAANSTALSIDDIGTAMQFVGGTASSLDQDLVNVLAALGILRNTNMQASVASTALNMVLTNMASPSREASLWMRRLGIEVTNADGSFKQITEIAAEVTSAFNEHSDIFRDEAHKFAVLEEMFGIRGARAMTIFMEAINNDADAMVSLASSFGNVESGLESMGSKVETYMNTPQALIATIRNSVQNLSTMLGEAFLIDPETGGVREFVVLLQDFLKSEGVKKFMAALGEALSKIASELLPLVIEAFEMFAPLLLELLDIIIDLVSDEGFKELIRVLLLVAQIFIDVLIDVFKAFIPSIKKLIPVIIKLLPLVHAFAIIIEALLPVFVILVDILIFLADVLVGLVPAIVAITQVLALGFLLILRIVIGAVALLVIGLGVLYEVISGDDSITKMGENFMTAVGKIDEATDSLKGFNDAMNSLDAEGIDPAAAADERTGRLIGAPRGPGNDVTVNVNIEKDDEPENIIEWLAMLFADFSLGGLH